MSLPALIQGCIEKNTKSQEELYQLYAGKLFSVCLKYSRNYAEAEDNLQDGFCAPAFAATKRIRPFSMALAHDNGIR